MQIRNFEDFEVWQEARRLTQEIYTCSRAPRFSRDYGLRDQMQRAAVSIMSNIAEGFERGGNQGFMWGNPISALCGTRSKLYRPEDRG